MASVVKLSKSGEANYAKANLAIKITKDGLEPFVENVIKEFQQKCLTDICNEQGLPAGTICKTCCTENLIVCPTNKICNAKRGKCSYHRSFATQYRPSGCPNKICDHFISKIRNAHRFHAPSYKNTDATQWCMNPWEVAKCFLPPDGYAYAVSATKTDFNGILSIIINHKVFERKTKDDLNKKHNVFDEAREIGKLVRRAANVEVKDHDLQRYFQVLKQVLSDGAYLASDNHAQNAVKQLLQLQNGVAQEDEANGAYGQLRTANETTTLTKKIKRKTELSPRISCIYDGRPIILEDDDRNKLYKNCTSFKKGGFGKIYKVEGNNVFNIPLAIKKIKTDDRSMRNLATNEMVVSRIRHQFILPLLATCFQEKDAYCEYWFISPFCENGDLRGALQLDISREEPKLEVEHRIKILFQIEKALEYLHTPVKGVRDAIIHKDVTSSNILLDGKFNARLIDFGIAREKNDVTNCRSGRDTYSHDDVGISAACEDWDYFSFGVVVREVLTSLPPEGIQHTYLKKMTKEEIMKSIQKPFKDNPITKRLNTIADFCLKNKKVDGYKSKVQNGLRDLMIDIDVTEERDPDKCHLCMVNPKAGDVKVANHHCINVCVSCEKTSFLNPIRCHCGNEIQPRIGYKWGALLVAGEDTEGSYDFTQDVLSFKEVITSRAPLIMGIRESSIQTVLPDITKPKQQSQRIVDAIENLPKDLHTLVINISCHGSYNDPFTFHLSASDTILLTTLEEKLRKYKVSNSDFTKVILICDCCYPRKINIKGIETEKIIQINSSKETQRSWIPTPDKETSYFSKFLIQGLKANTENAPCGTKDCTSCKEYWNYRKDYVTVENLFGYIHNHIKEIQEPQLLFKGSYDDSVIAYYTDEQECIEFTVHDDSDTETQRLLLDFSSDMCQIEAQLLEKSQKDKDSYTVAIQKMTFRTDKGMEPCKTFKEVVLAWETRQPLHVTFNPKNEQMDEEMPSPVSNPDDLVSSLKISERIKFENTIEGLQEKTEEEQCEHNMIMSLSRDHGQLDMEVPYDEKEEDSEECDLDGPDFDDEEEHGDGDKGGAQNGAAKPKTPQQRAGTALIKHIVEEVDGECNSFSEALPALSFFQSRQVRPTAWKCPLEIGPDLKIPINGYVKLKDFKLKWEKVYAKDTDMKVKTLRTFHKNDEEKTEVDKEDMVEGHWYGNTFVPMTDDDKLNMKYKAEKCFKVLGFTKAENVKRHEMMGDGVMTVVAEKGDEAAAVALSAIINALYDTNMVAIARRVCKAASSPRMGCLIPHIKAEYECLYWFELPFREDVRQFTFRSLPVQEENPTNKKYKPSEDQCKAVDDLITSMDLSTAGRDEDDKPCEVLKPKLIFNPYFQRLYQCLQHRALNPDDALPELSPLIANYLKPPEEVVTNCSQSIEKLKEKFKLEVVKKKEEKTGVKILK